jgi:hypothetical protein
VVKKIAVLEKARLAFPSAALPASGSRGRPFFYLCAANVGPLSHPAPPQLAYAKGKMKK